jgi:uncharacterized protein
MCLAKNLLNQKRARKNNSMHILESQRIAILDMIRGFALLGILIVNTPSLNTPAHMDTSDFAFQVSSADHVVTKIIFNGAMDCFYPIFALLFGIGAALFLSKERPSITKLYLRRLLFLCIIGIFHAFLVWWGDILIVYSVLGIFLLFFYSWQPKNILKLIGSIFAAIYLIALVQSLGPAGALGIFAGPDTFLIYSQGSFYDVTIQRMHDWVRAFFLNAKPIDTFIYFLRMFGIMLLGMWVHKQKILHKLEENSKLLGLFILFLLIINIITSLFPEIIWPFRGLSRGLLYILILLGITKNKLVYKFLAPLAYNGRMSMTNYLGFNICLSIIFYGYGLGIYGSMGPARQMIIAFMLYFIFLGLSALWLSHFRFGPFEYLWRLATYGDIVKAERKILTNS